MQLIVFYPMADCATEASSKHTRGHPVHVLGYTKILRGAKIGAMAV